jgi:phage terminase large subunit
MDAKDVRRLQAIVEELRRRGLATVEFSDERFKIQQQVLRDKSRAQAWKCTRRAGKSTTFGKKALNRIVNNPNNKALYLALTLDSAKGILWDIIERELDEHRVPHQGYRQEGRFQLKNGSQLKFFGVDATYREMKRILGQAYACVGLDECGSMTVDMENLVYQNIWPALSDHGGDLVLLGTAENIPRTFFQRVTEGKEKTLDWKVYEWTAHDNPYMATQWSEMINDMIRNDPSVVNASWFKTHYLNMWCADDSLLIVHVDSHNFVDGLPGRELFYVLGVDLGYNDASAFTVLAYHPSIREIYVAKSFKHTEMDFTAVAETINRLKSEFPVHQTVIDGANKQGVEEIKRRHGISLVSAEKTDKNTYLRLLADDFRQGVIKLVRGECDDLARELAELQWKSDYSGEDPRCANHNSDSLLYGWRYTMNTRTPTKEKIWTPDEQLRRQFQEEGLAELERMREQRFLY